jgi:hypothetical protein
MSDNMTPEEYKALLAVSREARDQGLRNQIKMEQMSCQLDDIHDVLYKNGFLGRMVRLEQLMASERERVDLKFDAQGQVAGLKIDSVKERAIDWKWLANLLVGGSSLGVLLQLLLGGQ